MSNRQSPLLNHWLTIGSVAFGVSFGCALILTQNLVQSALIVLATSPGVAASAIVGSRQHQRQLGQKQGSGKRPHKQRLAQLQQRGKILTQQLQLREQDRQSIELRITQLHHLAANLTSRIDRDQARQLQLEQQLTTCTTYLQEQENITANLDRKIQEKQACLLEVDTNLNTLKLELSQIQSVQIQLVSTIDRATQSLTELQTQIAQNWLTKQELELQIQQLQHHKIVETGEFDQSVEQKYLLLQELDLAIRDRQKNQQDLTEEITKLEHTVAQQVPELEIQAQLLADVRSQLSEAELAVQAKQSELAELNAVLLAVEILEVQNDTDTTTPDQDPLSDRLLQRELKIAQLELSSRQAELDNLEFKLQKKLESINELDLADSFHVFEPQPPIVDRDIDQIVCVGEWCDKFIDNPHLIVLKHIEKHGTITESEASKKLGNPRSVRQFANKLADYAENLPFSIRVESSPKGNRYIKEDLNQ